MPLEELGLQQQEQQQQEVASSSSSRSSSPGLLGGSLAAAAQEQQAAEGEAGDDASRPPITYLLIYEDSRVSMGIFCLPARARIPLHNHPGMTVLSRCVAAGTAACCCLQCAAAVHCSVVGNLQQRRWQLAVRCSTPRGVATYRQPSRPPPPSPQGAVRPDARLLLRLGAARAGAGCAAAAPCACRAGRHALGWRPARHPVPLCWRQHPRVHCAHRLCSAGPDVAALLHRYMRAELAQGFAGSQAAVRADQPGQWTVTCTGRACAAAQYSFPAFGGWGSVGC